MEGEHKKGLNAELIGSDLENCCRGEAQCGQCRHNATDNGLELAAAAVCRGAGGPYKEKRADGSDRRGTLCDRRSLCHPLCQRSIDAAPDRNSNALHVYCRSSADTRRGRFHATLTYPRALYHCKGGKLFFVASQPVNWSHACGGADHMDRGGRGSLD